MNEAYPIGTKVIGEVTEVTLLGVKVALKDSRVGFIRRRDLSWNRAVRHPGQFVSAGQQVTAVVIAGDDGYGRLALSLRQAEYDPWQAFEAQQYQVGQVVRGRIVNLVEYGAFVEIIRGVQGLIHVSEITDEWVSQVDKFLWHGDHVEAVITKIERAKKHVSLSIKERLHQIERRTKADISRRQFAEAVVDHLRAQQQLNDDDVVSRRQTSRRRILIVDDDRDARQSLGSWLERNGHAVTQAADGETAIERVHEAHELVFMDVDLPHMDGVEAARRIRSRFPTMPIVMITSVNWAEDRRADLEALDAMDVLLKPLDANEVLAAVEEAVGTPREMPIEVEEELAFFKRLAVSADEPGRLEEALTTFLRELCVEIESDAALIIRRDAASGEFTVAAQNSRLPLEFEAIKYQLAFSPVRDVVEDEAILFEDQAAARHNRGRFKYLLPLIPKAEFNACIGVPVKTFNEVSYGLFLFHLDAGRFTRRHFRRTLAAATTLGAAIERDEMRRQLRRSQQFVLAGQLSASLIHEINNRLSNLGTELNSLLLDVKPTDEGSNQKPPTLPVLAVQVDRIAAMTQEVIKTAHLFQRLIKADRREQLDLKDVLQSAYQSLRHRAYQAGVVIELESSSDIPRLASSEVRLLQAFVNVMLNAIQQCRRGATLTVRATHEPDTNGLPIKIRFDDNGPGIHGRYFEQIFDFGFTTRQDGSGMGLFISRGLIESVGGRICVEESYMLLGTTFLIELPIEAPGREEMI